MTHPIEQRPGSTIFSELSQLSWEVITRSPKLLASMAQATRKDAPLSASTQVHLARAFARLWLKMMQNPLYIARAQADLAWDTLALWSYGVRRALGQPAEPAAAAGPKDRRFRHEGWDNAVFDFIKQSYLVMARWMIGLVDNVEGVDEQTAEQVSFYTKQFADALSPSNFAMTNPEVLRTSVESLGANLARGMRQLLADVERGNGRLKIRRTDLEAFEVGRNLAVTPGKVVFQNELMQLIQYEPTTEKAHERPLLIVPPWINKYYILDLQPKNSFVRWAVERGFTVFIISWVNPTEELAETSFEDYLHLGTIGAVNAIEKATGEDELTAIGYCLGGTLLVSTLAHMTARGDNRIKAATFFTTLTDFAKPGEIGVFIDDEQVSALVREMKKQGVLEGATMQTAFNMLRANDLIWSYVVSNYLLGQDPFPFDLLYWNADATRMPAAMHAYYLGNMYVDNKLVEPGGLTLAGVPIDLSKVEVPTYFLSCREDHIAPWTSTYAGTQVLGGTDKRMVLSASGHIAGVVNPPSKKRYCYWTNDALPADPEAWLADAERHEGSWWGDWAAWNAKHSGALIPARVPGEGEHCELKPIEDAPGSYVRS